MQGWVDLQHCSRGAQPVPKAAYCSGCHHKQNRPQWDSNLGPTAVGRAVLGHCDKQMQQQFSQITATHGKNP